MDSSISVIYLVLLGIGVIYAILILIGTELHDIHIPGIDLHLGGHDIELGGHADLGATVDHPEVRVPSLSPVTVASFVTAFGAFGLIGLNLFNATTQVSLAWAAIGGVIIAVIAHFAFGYFLIAPQGSSEVRLKDLAGTEAVVITPIPAGNVGEIAFVAQGGRVTYTAKSASGLEIHKDVTVVIEKVVGGVAIVHLSEE